MRYRGRNFCEEEIKIIEQVIKEAPEPKYRTPISKEICRRLRWTKPDGGLKDMACRVALLQMEQDGIVRLPPVIKCAVTNIKVNYSDVVLPPLELVRGSISELAIEISLVTRKSEKKSKLWNTYIDRYHYLGFTRLGGAQLRYIVTSQGRLIAFLGFSAAAWKTKARDEFIGWTQEQKETKLHLIVNNSRFLILPSVEVPNLASYLLGRIVRRLAKDWKDTYGYFPLLVETFVQKDKFKGTCYKAANWIPLGDTTGRGKYDPDKTYSIPIKTVWVYPLTRKFKVQLLKQESEF